IYAAKDHLAKLVGIAYQLSDPPFRLVHHALALAFSIVVFWISRKHPSSWNCLATCQLLLFTADLILSFRAQHTGTKGKDKIFWRLTKRVRRFSDLRFFVFQLLLFLFTK
ncbi:hypothetical protein MTR67_006943, partial [Solanum verrucosum]